VTPRPLASVLIPTHNPGSQIDRVLDAIFSQEVDFQFEVVIVDSTSRIEDVERIRAHAVRFQQISQADFGHGRTRNHLASLAEGEYLLYLSQDAEPVSPAWMRTLLEPFSDANVAGAYAQQIPKPNADPLARFFLARTYHSRPMRRCLAPGRPPRIADIFFSNVSSAIRRSIWERVPFRPHVIMSEDQYWAYDALKAGYDIVYHPAAQVYHSHNYSLRTLFHRNWQSGASLRGLIADKPVAVATWWMSYVTAQAAYLVRNGCATWLPYMLVYEATKAVAFNMGMRFGQQRV
jgi:rhamnosyltransferase